MGIEWKIAGTNPMGQHLVFENQFIVAIVTRLEDAEFLVRIHNNAVHLAAGAAALRKSATP